MPDLIQAPARCNVYCKQGDKIAFNVWFRESISGFTWAASIDGTLSLTIGAAVGTTPDGYVAGINLSLTALQTTGITLGEHTWTLDRTNSGNERGYVAGDWHCFKVYPMSDTILLLENTGARIRVTPDLVADGGEIYIDNNANGAHIQIEVMGAGSGGMSALTYDANGNGVVDNAERLGGHDASYFMPLSYLDTDDTMAANSDSKVPSQAAVVAYVAANSGGSGGGRTLFAELVSVDDTHDTLTIDSIPGGHQKIVVEWTARDTEDADVILCYFSSDGNDYHYLSAARNLYSTTPVTSEDFADNNGAIAFSPCGASAPAGAFSSGAFEILQYDETVAFKVANFHWGGIVDSTTNFFAAQRGSMVWKDTGAVTKIVLQTPGGYFVTGSVFRVYLED